MSNPGILEEVGDIGSNYTEFQAPENFILAEKDDDWYPRWYYIFENMTTGKLYLGQTKEDVNKYKGSGRYWAKHCKKHGGWDRTNIAAIWTRFFELEEDAKEFLKIFDSECSNYWSHRNKEWANLIPETTDNYAGCSGSPELIEILRRNAYRMFGSDNPASKEVIIDGIAYASMRAASKTTGLSLNYIRAKYIKGIIEKELTEEELVKRSEQRSEISRKMWESEEYRVKWKESVSAAWTKEKRAEHAQKLKEVWQTEEYRENWKSSVDKYWDNDANRLECSERNRRSWENAEERREHIGEISKGLWQSQEYREKQKLSQNPPKAEEHYNFKGYYVTPFGKFTSPDAQDVLARNSVYRWCREKSDTLISGPSYFGSKWLQENYTKQEVVGKKTFRDLGFWFEKASEQNN